MRQRPDHSPSASAPTLRPVPTFRLKSDSEIEALLGPPLPPDRARVDHYDVLDLLALGGMGGVYLAQDRRTGERVALKVLDPRFAAHPDLVARLFDELEVSARCRHDGLVEVRAARKSRCGLSYLVMELVDGENLGQLLDGRKVELGAIAAFGAQIADAVAAMHEAGVVHCDLKPENVLVRYEHGLAGWPRIKVLDYGVAQFVERPVPEPDAIAGTPAYMAPEQWHGAVDRKTDVYALGCLLYELLTGTPPFRGSLADTMTAHCEVRPTRPRLLRSGLGDTLDDLVMRMLAKDPGLRPRMCDVACWLTELAFAHPPGSRDEDETTLMAMAG
ncbi:MAG: serine/threonine protein kinase [Kofleriaceae bacterium]|nr:serine/threonine protein kinase [Kofleriaceae bacterium]MBP6838239.1 serine/threonine protein kinase [Kofleriaceae bacterium]MBP9204671.1 serine/threonine protein kinase [Kofleriaceae bacterium]